MFLKDSLKMFSRRFALDVPTIKDKVTPYTQNYVRHRRIELSLVGLFYNRPSRKAEVGGFLRVGVLNQSKS